MLGSLVRQRARAVDDRKELFEQLLRSTSRQTYNLAFRLTGNAAEAEDLVQETFVRAYRFFHRYDESLPFINWVCRIMSNAHIDMMRRRGRLKLTSLEQPTASGFATIDAPDYDSSPDRDLMEQSMDENVQTCLNEMTPAFRQAVLLADVEGMAYEEIAEIMNTSVGTVRSRIHRGRRQLKSFLTKRYPTTYGGASYEL
jgi:RNA polymerase sigma-70 factor (ECF subfamily)